MRERKKEEEKETKRSEKRGKDKVVASARVGRNGMLDGKLQCGDGEKYRLRRVMRSEESSGSQAKLGV